jgi:hypothetical protein
MLGAMNWFGQSRVHHGARADRYEPVELPVETLPQPDETTCGPTCLHAVYAYWNDREPLQAVIRRMRRLDSGGTYAVFLGSDALRKGYRARIYTYNLTVFDPSWFGNPRVDMRERLARQQRLKPDPRIYNATEGYLEFLELGGRIRFANLSQSLIGSVLRRRLPLLTGLSSTFLYRQPREYGPEDEPDDIRGVPQGHFVVIAGWHPKTRKVLVVDPYRPHRYGPSLRYWLGIDRVVAAILLGIVTHDANVLIVYKDGR